MSTPYAKEEISPQDAQFAYLNARAEGGEYTGAILTIVAVGSTTQVGPGSVVGGLVTAFVVY